MKIYIRFDDGPGPVAGRFIEVENSDGASIKIGKWIEEEGTGHWLLELDALLEQMHPEGHEAELTLDYTEEAIQYTAKGKVTRNESERETLDITQIGDKVRHFKALEKGRLILEMDWTEQKWGRIEDD